MLASVLAAYAVARNFFAPASFLVGIFSQINPKVAICVITLLSSSGVSYYEGYSNASHNCKANELAAQLAEIKLEVAKAKTATNEAEIKATYLSHLNNDLNNKVEAYISNVQKREGTVVKVDSKTKVVTTNSCLLTNSDVRSLRNFAK